MAATLTSRSFVTDAHRRQFAEEGYFILDRVIPEEHLQILRDSCDYLIDAMHEEMDRLGTDHVHISHRGKRYHIAKKYDRAPRLGEYVFSELMAEVCRATIGESAYLFYDQYVVKSAERGIKFSWHQDSGYLGFPHCPYVTVWAAVDDMTEQNGTAYVLPFSTSGIRSLVEHVRDPETGDKVGYFGRELGIPAVVPAGSLVVFSSLTFHRSGMNTTDRMRRAYVTQYSAEPIYHPDTHELVHLGVPFLKGGEIVSQSGHRAPRTTELDPLRSDSRPMMNRSKHRILTTHVGSLARPDRQLKLLFAKERGEPCNPAEFAASTRQAVEQVVARQVAAGIDIVCDGEQGKSSFLTYITERLAGFSPCEEQGEDLWIDSRETLAFPEFYEAHRKAREGLVAQPVKLVCTGPVTYVGHEILSREIETIKAAGRQHNVADLFMTAVSPSDVEGQQANAFYESAEAYLYAIADALHEEYRAIVEAGLILQIDDPRLLTYYISHPELSVDDCRRWAEVRVEALNHALRGLPAERIRFHTCYGINIGPRVHEMNLADIVDIMLKVNAGAYLFEAANPRHEHEWKVWENVRLPEGKLIVPGVISHSTPLVEHPELVAQRLVRFARVVGKENVMGGADCGFASFAATQQEIHPSIVWAKFANLAEGARIASRELWP